MLDQLEEAVPLGRQLEEPEERIAEDDGDHPDHREDQAVGRRAACGRRPHTAPPPGRPQERPGGGRRAGVGGHSCYGWLSTDSMLAPADSAACLTVSLDRKSTRLNSSHANISYAVFCLK